MISGNIGHEVSAPSSAFYPIEDGKISMFDAQISSALIEPSSENIIASNHDQSLLPIKEASSIH